MARAQSEDPQSDGSWTLLTAHGRALVEIARSPESRMVDIATVIGVTERTAQAIVADLEAAGYLIRERVGRRNRYTVNPEHGFRHRAQDGHVVGPFLDLLAAYPDEMSDAAH
jgi:DNA-binding MarR family transcriptional regulator